MGKGVSINLFQPSLFMSITLNYFHFMIFRCNDSSLPGMIPVNRALEFRVVVNDTIDMLGNFQ